MTLPPPALDDLQIVLSGVQDAREYFSPAQFNAALRLAKLLGSELRRLDNDEIANPLCAKSAQPALHIAQ